MNKRKYIMFTMIIIGALSILEWGISFSSIFLIVSMALVYIVFPMKDLCSKSKYLKTFYNIYKVIIIIFVSSFVLLDEIKQYDSITIHINDRNNVSKKVFTHIGFKPTSSTLYKISMEDIIKWLEL